MESLKKFVANSLTGDSNVYLTLNSGRLTTKANLGTIIQMGIAIKKMNDESPNNKNEEEEEDEEE
jgi:hypothetical protein